MVRTPQRSLFPLGATTVCLIALFAAIATMLKPFVPGPNIQSKLDAREEDYLKRGTKHAVNWVAFSTDVFSQARRSQKPVFMLIGDMCSFAARQADDLAFSNYEAAQFLNREYICVRVDASQYPSWLRAFLPYSRDSLRFDPLLQCVILSPEGNLISVISSRDPDARHDQYWLLDALRSLRRTITEQEDIASAQFNNQIADRNYMYGQPEAEPRFDLAIKHWTEWWRVAHVMPERMMYSRLPNAVISMLNRIGEVELAQQAGQMVLRSPIVDWLDGGFFRLSRNLGLTEIETDKVAEQNAEIMAAITENELIRPNALQRRVILNTFDALANDFSRSGFMRCYRIGDQGDDLRSDRSSFSPAFLRNNFSPEDRQVLRKELGLEVESNPQMLVTVRNANSDLSPKAVELLKRLRTLRGDTPQLYESGTQADVHTTCAAKMLRTARLLGDEARLAKARTLVDSALAFRIGPGDVIHTFRSEMGDYGELRDYLGYADMMLQEFLAFGRTTSLEDGSAVLLRALDKFATDVPGALLEAQPKELGPLDAPLSSLVDDLGESSTAKSIRLAMAYAALDSSLVTSNRDIENPNRLRSFARSAVQRFSPAANTMSESVAGFFAAAATEERDLVVFVKSPDAVKQASALARRLPVNLVAPLVGRLHAAWANQPDGIYAVVRGEITGPLTEAACVDFIRTR